MLFLDMDVISVTHPSLAKWRGRSGMGHVALGLIRKRTIEGLKATQERGKLGS